ncbi:MAG: M18 family aminopeptidase, partial [Clostridia bacterium]|nr:M18 family aminopeptidase [Clostridia bacterium]
MSFIDRVPTAFHAVEQIAAALDAAGYVRLQEIERWPIAPGGRYYVTRNQSSLIAFRLPEAGVGHFQIVASHGDSPSFKLKPVFARTGEGCALLNVEKYGGMLMSTWMDRPLSVAGRLIVDGPGGLVARLVNVERDLALIPNLPIHFNRDANDGVALNAQVDMLPVVGMEGVDFAAAIARAAGVEPNRVVGADLFLYNRQRAARFG